MGTRSLTIIQDRDQTEIMVMYRQMDGYIYGHGKELATFCKDIQIVNGISMQEKFPIANGMGCLAAQIVAHFKQEAGSFYLHPSGTRDCGEEYTYTVSQYPEKEIIGHNEKRAIHIKVEAYEKVIFDGPASELVDFQEPDEEEGQS